MVCWPTEDDICEDTAALRPWMAVNCDHRWGGRGRGSGELHGVVVDGVEQRAGGSVVAHVHDVEA